MNRRLGVTKRSVAEKAASFQGLFEASGVGMIMVGPDCMITESNRSASELSGWLCAELIGRRACAELLFQPEGPPLGCPGLCFHAGQEAAAARQELHTLRLRHKSGAAIPVQVSAAPLGPEGALGCAFLMWNVSVRTQLEEEAAIRRSQSEGLRLIGLEIANLTDLRANMEQVLAKARDLFRADLMAWGVLDESDSTVTWQAASGVGSERFPETVLPLRGTSMGRILTAGRPFVTHNLVEQSGADPAADSLFGDPPLKTAMAVPLRVRDHWYGILLAAFTAAQELTDEDVLLFTHLGHYLATAAENADLLEQVQHMAALEERQRLARELHDGFGQILTALGVHNLVIRRHAEAGDTAAVLTETDRVKEVLREAHKDVHRSIFQLKEGAEPRAPLADRWREMLASFEAENGLLIRYEVGEGLPARLPDPVELQLTRVLQEALVNVRNHSGARSATVRLAVIDQRLHLTVTDDGCGFESGTGPGVDQQHFGLAIMQERASAVGGALDVSSTLGSGTAVTLRMPLRGKER